MRLPLSSSLHDILLSHFCTPSVSMCSSFPWSSRISRSIFESATQRFKIGYSGFPLVIPQRQSSSIVIAIVYFRRYAHTRTHDLLYYTSMDNIVSNRGRYGLPLRFPLCSYYLIPVRMTSSVHITTLTAVHASPVMIIMK